MKQLKGTNDAESIENDAAKHGDVALAIIGSSRVRITEEDVSQVIDSCEIKSMLMNVVRTIGFVGRQTK